MTKSNITIRTTKEHLEFIKARAAKLGISANAYINLLFSKEMDYGKNYNERRNS